MNAQSLYHEVILDHNRRPRNHGDLPDASGRAEGLNPLCGDRLTVSVRLDDGRIGAIAFHGDSCAICKASGSMMTQAVKGLPVAEARALAADFRAMATGEADEARTHRLGRLSVFAGVAQLPGRVKCAVLPWHTLGAALAGQAHADVTDAP